MNSILVKLSGEAFWGNKKLKKTDEIDCKFIQSVVNQISTLKDTYKFGIVVGGGNFFRASKHGVILDIKRVTADSIGMMATVMNGLILQDFFSKKGIQTEIVSAFDVGGIVTKVSDHKIEQAIAENKIVIFVGGIGNPFFTTDTCAVLRALQIGASQVWKATAVDGIYDSDPLVNSNAKILKSIKYSDFLTYNLEVMDLTAISLAQKHKIKIRVFDLFVQDALYKVANDIDFGSTIE